MSSQGRAIAVLFVSMFLVMLGFGILIPVLPFYVRQFGGNATALGALMATYSVMQFFCAPLWGRLSDRIGRRPVLLIGLSGYGIAFILYGMATELWMLFAARTLAGLISSATLPTAMAYIADVTSDRDRARGMGLMGAAIGLGIILGPAVGGIAGEHSLSLPFFIAGGVALLNLPFAWRFLPESHVDRQQDARRPVLRLSPKLLHHDQFPLFVVALTVSFTMSLFESIFALFASDRVGMTGREMGIMFAVVGLVGVGLQGGGLGKLARRFGDVPLVRLALAVSALGFLAMLGATTIPHLWLCTALFALPSSILRPLISTLVTRTTTEGKGAVVGIQQSFDSLGRILGPLLGGALYDLSSAYPYLVGACTLVGVSWYCRQRLERFNMRPEDPPAPASHAG